MTKHALIVASLFVGIVFGRALAQTPSGAKATPPPTNCKQFGPGRCCDAAVAAHLTKESVFSACGESEATFLGEQGQKDTCKYFFKVAGQKDEDMFVQVYAPAAKDVPDSPTDPFFKYGRIGKVFYTEKALSPKAAPMIANNTGLWMPGKGYFVAVNASTKVCSKSEAKRLATKIK